jgi:hypothetical protein
MTDTQTRRRERLPPRAVIMLGLPRAQVRFLRREADRLGTRASVVAEAIIEEEMLRRRQATAKEKVP